MPWGTWNVPGPGIELATPALGRWILNHWITREVPGNMSFLVSRVGVEEERRLRVDSLEIYNSVDSKN